MPTTNHSEPSRWVPFTPAELEITRAALKVTLDEILEMGRLNSIPVDDREMAALTLLHAAKLAHEIDDHLGEPHPPLDVFALTSQMIADGSYAQEVKAAVDLEGGEWT